MGNMTERMSAADYLAMVKGNVGSRGGASSGKRKNKYGNRRGLVHNGEKYDSDKELKHHQMLELARNATDERERVIRVRRQVPFMLLEKQDGEREIRYFADFVVDYADGHSEVHDTKSPPTRKDKVYVMKRKMMLSRYDIRIREF